MSLAVENSDVIDHKVVARFHVYSYMVFNYKFSVSATNFFIFISRLWITV